MPTRAWNCQTADPTEIDEVDRVVPERLDQAANWSTASVSLHARPAVSQASGTRHIARRPIINVI